MNVSAQFGLAFDIGKFAVTNVYDTADTGRLTKGAWVSGELDDGQGVDLPDTFAFGLHQNLFQQNFILHTVSKITFTPFTLGQHLAKLLAGKRTVAADNAHFTQLFTDPERAERQGFLIASVAYGLAD